MPDTIPYLLLFLTSGSEDVSFVPILSASKIQLQILTHLTTGVGIELGL
jgi:hypothetical protein